MTFFLETNDPTPAAIRMRASRPVTSLDTYYIGHGPDLNGTQIPKYQTFDIARGSGAVPGTPLFEVLRDFTRYEHNMFTCNALSPTSPAPPAIFELCRLATVGLNDRAFLEGRSLIGTYVFTVRVEDLAGRTPVRFFAEVRYTYALP
jgi:hypothetical protein